MTRLSFGVSASAFAANMALKQNAMNYEQTHPKAALAVLTSFYIDDGLMGADSIERAIQLRKELQHLFQLGGFLLRKWKSSERNVLASIPKELVDPKTNKEIILEDEYTKVLGVQWNTVSDCFRPIISLPEPKRSLTKRTLVSDIARLYDVLGWCSPTIILMKIMLQRLWEMKLAWDESVPADFERTWWKWRKELLVLRDLQIT